MEAHQPLQYCVQYNESDLDFICRLLEQEGIYYFIEHQPDKNILHLSDSPHHYADATPAKAEHSSGIRRDEYIRLWQHAYEYCSGAFAQTDFDYEKFTQSLLTQTSTQLKIKIIAPSRNLPTLAVIKKVTRAMRSPNCVCSKKSCVMNRPWARAIFIHLKLAKPLRLNPKRRLPITIKVMYSRKLPTLPTT